MPGTKILGGNAYRKIEGVWMVYALDIYGEIVLDSEGELEFGLISEEEVNELKAIGVY